MLYHYGAQGATGPVADEVEVVVFGNTPAHAPSRSILLGCLPLLVLCKRILTVKDQKAASMASPSTVTNSSGSSLLQNSISSEDLKAVMDQRKRKRRISNRESARRSRMRKQQHLDDLNSELRQLREDNAKVLTSLSLITQHYFEVEAENSVLKIQLVEISNRLMALNDILQCCLSGSNAVSRGGFISPWKSMCMNQNKQIVASTVQNMRQFLC
ncbi:hypothetical protein ZIOFF_071868 [Zingiber officinale]|uniref:BZIP domain-containing protein n=2 Tax=Zingiber officinale TaxID=94328 RepID=A0A8J5C4C9_ZINOF|nr:hypothetical protein ZIOFF_071868 [Zingiber officinale]